jgi:hypothetical protein
MKSPKLGKGTLRIELKWEKPIRLKDGAKQDQIFAIRRLDRISQNAGVYIFARSFGKSVKPLYIGQTARLRGRINNHLQSNTRLMMRIKKAEAGRRILLVAHLNLLPGQQEQRVLRIVEKALVKQAVANGYELFNKQGVRARVHVIRSKGNTAFKKVAPLRMLLERK